MYRLLLIGLLLTTPAIAADFTLTSTAFPNGELIPTQYTCDGKDISPALRWTGAPPSTQSFALIASDPDAPSGVWYHWVVFNIPKTTHQIAENKLLANSLLGNNSWGKMQYDGPCPPPGKIHHYTFTLYALDQTLNLPEGVDADSLKNAMTGHLLKSTTLTGTFHR